MITNHFEVYLMYPVLQLYKESGTTKFVIILAPNPEPLQCTTRASCKSLALRGHEKSRSNRLDRDLSLSTPLYQAQKVGISPNSFCLGIFDLPPKPLRTADKWPHGTWMFPSGPGDSCRNAPCRVRDSDTYDKDLRTLHSYFCRSFRS